MCVVVCVCVAVCVGSDPCPALPSSCFNGGTCIDKINGYSCTCRSGFTGSHCQYEVNECDYKPCLNGGICQDGLESFRCSCPKGYTGNRCQVQTGIYSRKTCHSDVSSSSKSV